jgi:predicted PP-loop superfamily ATPase
MVNWEAVNCERVWHEISNYLEGDVEPGLRSAMDEHFQTCKRCSSVLEGTRNVIRLYGDERMIEAPAGFGRRLEKRLAQNARSRSGGSRWSTWSTWSAWLVPAAALVLFAGGLHVANSWTIPRPLKSEHAQPGKGIPPDMQVVVTDEAKIFHVAGCEFIHNKDKERTLTAQEAEREGYVPCLRCMRKYMETAVGHVAVGSQADAEVGAEADADAGTEVDAEVDREEIHLGGK